ncbi:thioredoxin-dependent thiol peroxidase [Rhizobium sp. LjRoot30]|uniref:thioredoxin-dependent thiol peroxidase n=1 Tax=Rhizobium sp. LjRoot30 TaxID=3342320 RepID=UPI003ECD9B37
MAELRAGDTAPDFDLPGNGGARLTLQQFRGKPLVLYFYPKDDTQSCTIEAVSFSEHKEAFAAAGASIVGISPDSPKRHDNFVKKYTLGIPLAADEEKSVISAYGLWKEKSMYGRSYMGVERTTFLIDTEGVIARVWNKVKVKGHVEEVLEAVRAAQ